MAAMTYIDFDLLVERFEQGYRVRVLNSPAGQASAVLLSPLVQLDLERFLTRVRRPYRGLLPGANRGPDAEIDARDAVVGSSSRNASRGCC